MFNCLKIEQIKHKIKKPFSYIWPLTTRQVTIIIFSFPLSFLLFFLPCRVVVRLSLAVLGSCGFSCRGGCVTPPYGNLGSKPHHFTITGVGVRELNHLAASGQMLYRRLQFSGDNAAKPLRCRDTELLSRNASTIYRRNYPRIDAATEHRNESSKTLRSPRLSNTNTLLYIRSPPYQNSLLYIEERTYLHKTAAPIPPL